MRSPRLEKRKRLRIVLFLFGLVGLILEYRGDINLSEPIARKFHLFARKNITKFKTKMRELQNINTKELQNTRTNNWTTKSTNPERQAENSKVVILFWSTVFGKVPKFNNSENRNCPVACEWTTDRSRAQEASAMIIHARDAYPMPDESKLSGVPLMLLAQENPVYTDVLSDADFMSRFTYLWGYHLDSDFYCPVLTKPKLSTPIPFSQKPGMVFAAFTNCEPGRTAYMKELMKYIPVDSYGSCLKNKDGLLQIYSSRGAKTFKDDKVEMVRKYKFTLVFFNQDCDYFIDDQLNHAWNAGSVPVFMGTNKIDELLHGNLNSSIIRVKDFKSPKLLAEYLHMLSENETRYNQYLRWKYEGFDFPASYRSSKVGQLWEHPFPESCRICIGLKNSRKPVSSRLKPILCRARTVEDYLGKTV